MTGYLLDTNVVSDLVRNPQGTVAQRIRKVGETKVCTSIIVASELRYGAEKKGSQRLTTQLEVVLGALQVLPFDSPADVTSGRVRAQLERIGKPIGGNDLLKLCSNPAVRNICGRIERKNLQSPQHHFELCREPLRPLLLCTIAEL